ncbi:MAG: hypothetical protein FD155_3391 [Bacteroidetes bacterium]|nr:MAG: hypothetical protein FD155_3391 [Bacteroidota bacterium]
MKRTIIIIGIAVLSVACNYFSKYTKVEGSILTISNFDCGLGVTGINQIHGDFNTLDKEVFNALKGKKGAYNIKLVYDKVKDQFGNKTTRSYDLGSINASALSNYANVTSWVSASGGTYKIIAAFLQKI